MESGPASVSMDFHCSPLSVWGVITSISLYSKWNPSHDWHDNLTDNDAFTIGTKIVSASDKITGVVSELQAISRFTVLYGQRRETIKIEASGGACRVTLEVLDARSAHTALSEWAERTLLLLKVLVYENLTDEIPTAAKVLPVRKIRRLNAAVAAILQGYRNPLKPNATLMDDANQMADLIDHTEGDVIVHLRAALVALMCTVFLFTTIVITSRFPRIDVIPSTGMSLYESDDVNKQSAFRIVVGMYKSDLELMTNCLGRQLNIHEYSYESKSNTLEGYPEYQLIISYDAYSRVRTVRFLDSAQSARLLQLHLSDLRPILGSNMSAQQIEQAVQYPLSGFILDISGITRVYFGVIEHNEYYYDTDGILSFFDLETRSELVIETEMHRDTVAIEYNFPYDADNPLPYVVSDKLRRQYSNYLTRYLNDRAAYERIFYLFAKTQTEVEMVIGPAMGYRLDNTGVHQLSSPDSGYDWYYVYEVVYSEIRTVTSVTIHNRFLENRSDTLLSEEQYAFWPDMSLYELYEQMGVLPSFAVITADSLVLGFGSRLNQQANPMFCYEMCFDFTVGLDRLDLSGYLMSSFRVNA